MHSNIIDTEAVFAGEVIEMATWNRQRTTDELVSFISGRHALLEDVELGI